MVPNAIPPSSATTVKNLNNVGMLVEILRYALIAHYGLNAE